jgi:hypothetical protein
MRFVSVIFVFLISVLQLRCAATSAHNEYSNLKFSAILNIKMDTATQGSLVSMLGEPSHIEQSDNYFIMIYDDPNTNFQKLSVNVDKKSKKLLSLFWSPEEDELESSLDYVKRQIANADYQVKEDKNIPNHMVSSGILFYIDKKAGVTIRYDKRRDKVEAIALYEREHSIVSSTK